MDRFGQIHDPGLQQERTVLAWDRTALALMVAAGLLQRSLGEPLLQPASAVAAVCFVLGLGVLIVDRPRYLARWRRLQEGAGMLEATPVLAVAAGAVVLGITALAVVLV